MRGAICLKTAGPIPFRSAFVVKRSIAEAGSANRVENCGGTVATGAPPGGVGEDALADGDEIFLSLTGQKCSVSPIPPPVLIAS